MTHRFINADGYVSTGTGILGHNMFAYCDNNPVNYSDPYGNACVCLTRRVHPKHVCNDLNRQYVLSSSSNTMKFAATDNRVGGVKGIVDESFPLFYTKAGYYNVQDYHDSCFSAYTFSNYSDFWQSEVGVEILNSFSFSLGFENIGLQLPIPFTETSIEASLSLMEGCVRVGWDETRHVDDHFIVGGGGVEINYFKAASVGATVIGVLTFGDKIISLSSQFEQVSYAFNGGY